MINIFMQCFTKVNVSLFNTGNRFIYYIKFAKKNDTKYTRET